jgi:hypothetical protein
VGYDPSKFYTELDHEMGWILTGNVETVPSGKRLHNYGKSPFLSSVNPLFQWAIFNSYVSLPEGNI